MLRSARWLGLLGPLLLTGCSGFAVFLDDTHNPTPHMNRPIGNSETMREVEGRSVAIAPLQPETGNVWPGPIPPTPTLQDLAKQPMQPVPPLEEGTPTPANSTVPNLIVPQVPHHLQPRPDDDTGVLNGPLFAPPPVQAPPPPLPPTKVMPADKSLGIVVPNGDGTSTVIAPDGSISTIPTPK